MRRCARRWRISRKEAGLNRVMLDAALRGSVGSVAIQLRVLRGRVFLQVLDTTYLTPRWDPEAPDTLLSVTEAYKVPGRVLAAQGYALADEGLAYWFMRRWDAEAETWFEPWPVGQHREPVVDEARTVRHGLGFVPLVWIRNLPGGDGVDGACTFRPAIETAIEIDYQLSQAGRGLKYSSDPTLLVREPAAMEGELIRGGGNALVVSEKGDAKLLEINGTAAAAVIEYVRTLRELALEGVHGNRASADRLSAAQSGRALELMNQGLVWLADNLRVSYGAGLLELARMVIRASNRYALRTHGERIPPLDLSARVGLKWPRWYPPTAEDRLRDAQTLRVLAAAGTISRETALKSHRRRLRHRRRSGGTGAHCSREDPMSEDDPASVPAEDAEARAAALERRLAELEAQSRERLIRAELKAEAVRAGMVDLDGLKLVDAAVRDRRRGGRGAGRGGADADAAPGQAVAVQPAPAPPARRRRRRRSRRGRGGPPT